MKSNFEFKKSFGQNFLRDDNICKKIVDNANIDKDTLVIEIGPGEGAISKYIISKCGYYIMYEIDTRLKDRLESKFNSYDNYEIVFNDFMKEDVVSKFKQHKYKKLYVVANLPYYITTPIISKFIDDEIFPDKIVVMIQREVALRLSASPGSKDYGSLTVFLNYYYKIRKLFDVSRNCFEPKPNVDSAVICMDIIKDKKKVNDIELFKNLVRDSFRYKRKTIRNNLKGYDLDIIENVLKKYGFGLDCRAEVLGLDIFIDMCNELCK